MDKSNLKLIKLLLGQDKSITLEQKESVLETLAEEKTSSEVMLTQREAAKYLNVSRSTIFRMCRDKQITPVIVRGLRRYRRDDLDRSNLLLNTENTIPKELQKIEDLQELSIKSYYCGVYFLCAQDACVYVGQSVNVASRAACHNDKAWDRAYFMSVSKEDLSRVEREMIDTLMPKYNKDSLTRKKLRCMNT